MSASQNTFLANETGESCNNAITNINLLPQTHNWNIKSRERALTLPASRGDGGAYSDIDTLSLKPIEDWIPPSFRGRANIVIGIEYDRAGGDRWLDWTLDLQFCTWAILAKPGHPLMQMTVDQAIARLKRLALKQGTTISGIKASREEVLDTTGPALFTQMVFEKPSYTPGTNFTYLNITRLGALRMVDDVLILPINAFGCGQRHSNSGSPDDDSALVKHLFKGSWKNDHRFEEGRRMGLDVQEEAPATEGIT